LFDRNIRGLGALQQFDQLAAHHVSEELHNARAITDETTLLSGFRPLIHSRKAQRDRALDNQLTLGKQQRRGQDVEARGIRSLCCVDGAADLLQLGNLMNRQFDAARTRRVL